MVTKLPKHQESVSLFLYPVAKLPKTLGDGIIVLVIRRVYYCFANNQCNKVT